jgi:hypothetical protein
MNYKPYFYINKVGVFSKTYNEHKKEMLFFDKDGKLHATIKSEKNIYNWEECERIFGDEMD